MQGDVTAYIPYLKEGKNNYNEVITIFGENATVQRDNGDLKCGNGKRGNAKG
jgi:hypothetical protein